MWYTIKLHTAIHNRISDPLAHGTQHTAHYACACRVCKIQTNTNQRIQSRKKVEMEYTQGEIERSVHQLNTDRSRSSHTKVLAQSKTG